MRLRALKVDQYIYIYSWDQPYKFLVLGYAAECCIRFRISSTSSEGIVVSSIYDANSKYIVRFFGANEASEDMRGRGLEQRGCVVASFCACTLSRHTTTTLEWNWKTFVRERFAYCPS